MAHQDLNRPAPNQPAPKRPQQRRRRAVLVRSVQVVVTIGIFVLLWRVADGADALQVLLSADALWLLGALVALTLHTVLAAERWRVTAGALGLPLGRWHALREYYLAQLVNQTVPGGVVGDAGRAVRSREQAGLTVAAQAVVVERFAGQVAVLGTMAVAVVVTTAIPGGLEWPVWMLSLAGAITLGSLALIAVLLAARFVPGRFGARAVTLSSTAGQALFGRRLWLPQLLLSTGTTACILVAFWASAVAVGLSLSFGAVVTLVPLILLTMLIPITISGWGLREGAAAALLPLAGATASASLAASVAFGLVGLLAVLPGAAVVWMSSRSPSPSPSPV